MAENTEKTKKTIFLKQFLVTELVDGNDSRRMPKAAFVLNTCAAKAREEFENKFGVCSAPCMQTANSDLTKDDLSRDLWAEGRNYVVDIPRKSKQSAAQKRYFELKERGEKLAAAKRKLGITSWDGITYEQLRRLNSELGESN